MPLVSCRCPNCNAIQNVDSKKDAAICEQCGAPFVVERAIVQQEQQSNPEIAEKRKIQHLPIIIIACCAILAIVIGVIAMNNRPVKEVSLSNEEISMKAGSVRGLSVDITPENAKDKTILWSSSNPSVATVSESGVVKAKSPGVSEIGAKSSNGIKAICRVYVEEPEAPAASTFSSLYKELNTVYHCTLANDESYLLIDTNPSDIEGEDRKGIWYVKRANEYLGFPESLMVKMEETRAIDGRQTETIGKYRVSWTYVPDRGLEVLYELAS